MIVTSIARIAVAVAVAFSSSSVSEGPTRFASKFGCVASLPAPHPSGSAIKAHMRISCRASVAAAHVEVQLWRLRAWWWEKIGKPGEYSRPSEVRTVDTFATAAASPSDCYYYRSTGKGHIFDWRGLRIDTPGEGVNYDERYKKGLPPGCGTKW